jgi:hypothetical protein
LTEAWLLKSGSERGTVFQNYVATFEDAYEDYTPDEWPEPDWCGNLGSRPNKLRSISGAATSVPSPMPYGGAYGGFGGLLYVPLRLRNAVHFQARVHEVSRAPFDLTMYSAGSALPIVRENEFLNAATVVPNVPEDPRYRVRLHIFVPKYVASSTFAIRLIDHDSGEVRATASVTVSQRKPKYDAFPVTSGYAAVDIARDAFPQVIASDAYDVEVANTFGATFWFMVTLTNNETNLPTVLAPE